MPSLDCWTAGLGDEMDLPFSTICLKRILLFSTWSTDSRCCRQHSSTHSDSYVRPIVIMIDTHRHVSYNRNTNP